MVLASSPPVRDSRSPTGPILEVGRNCWRIARADRLSVIIDAANYFAAVRQAILEARHSVYLIGWDFDTRVSLDPDATDGAPKRLGRFLDWIARTRPGVKISLLKWDMGVLFSLGRGSTPLFVLDWMTHENVRLKLDGAHPATAAHHHKIVVVDDVLAFCGGIDITADRWDTRDHLDDDPRRRRPTTRRRYGPWHDATTAVSGPAAAALGELARDRWLKATGERLEAPPPAPPIWPVHLGGDFDRVNVAIARTNPAYDGRPEVREIERLYLDAIAAARRSVYLESQYFASKAIAEAIGRRLAEPDGPEFVIVNPQSADGWLEEEVMGGARAILLEQIRAVDLQGRFRLYYPVTEKGRPIYVHAKILIVDDRILRVGSSNLNNRSMGFDTESDLAIEAGPDTGPDDPVRVAIRRLRADLLAEHLGADAAAVETTLALQGSLLGAVEILRGAGRSLQPLEPPEIGAIQRELADRALLDPATARPAASPLKRRLSRLRLPRRPGRTTAGRGA
ncbi:phospholipase D-like domain-containing protein [Chthonobacter rhizosphaerae]|uniref:phospholipase D-like domain-containing protein n=1 Tax=Chthonobacter rhizosphaerae TaxID=2735553 RepID=UPI0015EFB37A|nr:phospholipase D-like domain-containing protein [Chthonobacter rhizosphaerae]